jgi:hypothetical protein
MIVNTKYKVTLKTLVAVAIELALNNKSLVTGGGSTHSPDSSRHIN